MRNYLESFLRYINPQKKRSYCSICYSENRGFRPLPEFYREKALEHGYSHFGKGEMTALETYTCAHCGATDRERLYAYWLSKMGRKRIGKALHFAPEPRLSEFIQSAQLFESYQTADLFMETVDHQVDLMNLPFPTNSYDFFICSHVLEHVFDDKLAIRELYRITKPGGCGILMAPIIVGLEQTIEDPTVTSEAERWRLFGQFDHVRLYARNDYVKRIEAEGFSVAQLDARAFGDETFSLLGLKPASVLYIATKE